jgi:hypothetical protein
MLRKPETGYYSPGWFGRPEALIDAQAEKDVAAY